MTMTARSEGSAAPQRTDVALFVDPFSHHFLEDRLFEWEAVGGGESMHAPWAHLRDWFGERGIAVFTADRLVWDERRADVNVYISLGMYERCRELAQRDDVSMSAFFAFEGPIVDPGLYRNLSWLKDCVKRIYSFSSARALAPFLTEPIELHPFCVTYPHDGVHAETWSRSERDFLVMINGNRLPRLFVDELYTERLRAVEFFGRSDEIDLYGIGWNEPPYRPYAPWVPRLLRRTHRKLVEAKDRVRPDPLLVAARRVYHGPIPTKCETLGKYRFSICYENQILEGWITEKIFDCFRAGTVPVYWGAPDIEEHIPAECYIDRRKFASQEELRQFLLSLSPDETHAYREAGRAFLSSDRFYPFSKQAFTDRCACIVHEDTGVLVE